MTAAAAALAALVAVLSPAPALAAARRGPGPDLAGFPLPLTSAPEAPTTPEVAANETAADADDDVILARILADVWKDVPEPRSGISRSSWVVQGSVTATWSSYSSFSGGSFGGGVSEFFGAGGSVSMDLGAAGGPGGALSRYNALYPGFGGSGAWLSQPRQERPGEGKRSAAAGNATEAAAAAGSVRRKRPRPPLDVATLMTQLWAAVALRDNMVTVLGYVLNRPDNPLSAELYTSLYHVYDAIRLRRVQTFDLIKTVRDLAGGTPTEQFLALFRGLRKIVPRYLLSAVSVWVDTCRRSFPLLDSLLRPGGGPLVVDFLAGIEASVVTTLGDPLQWSHSQRKENAKVKELMGGSVFVDIFTALHEGTLELTQQLFAIILVNRPINDVVAQKDETERFLADVLRLGNVEPWDQIVAGLVPDDMADPDRLISRVLLLVSRNRGTAPRIREDARYLRLYIRKPSVAYANKYYDVISRVISRPSIDLLSMLRAVTPEEYPREIVETKDQIVEYILSGQLNVEFIIKGFNRFDHVSPANVLIALLTRIDRRLSGLPQTVLRSVKTLQLSLVHKQFLGSMAPDVPVGLLDVSSVASAYDAASIPEGMKMSAKKLVKTLTEEKIPWAEVASQVPLERCTRPRQCIYSSFRLILENEYIASGPALDALTEFVAGLDENGNPASARPEDFICYAPGGNRTSTTSLAVQVEPTTARNIAQRPNATSARRRKPAATKTAPTQTAATPGTSAATLTTTPVTPRNRTARPAVVLAAKRPAATTARSARPRLTSPTTTEAATTSEEEEEETFPATPSGKITSPKGTNRTSGRPGAAATERLTLKRKPTSPRTVPQQTSEEDWSYEEDEDATPPPGKIENKQAAPKATTAAGKRAKLGPAEPSATPAGRRPKAALPADDARFLSEVSEAARRVRPLPFPSPSAVHQEEPALGQYPATCLPASRPGSPERHKLLPAQILLAWPRLPKLLGPDFSADAFAKKGELLLALLEALGRAPALQPHEDLLEYVQSYLQVLYKFKKSLSAVSMVYFPSLLNALPVVSTDVERQYSASLKNQFTRADFYQELGDSFDPRLHKTRGLMLKYVFDLMEDLPMVKWNPILKKALVYYRDKVYLNGYGAQGVEWALVSESCEPMYVDMSVFKALDHGRMPAEALRAEYEVIRFLFTDFIPNVHLADLNVKLFRTKGQFLKAVFDYLLRQDTVNPRVKDDIGALKKFVRMDGRGAEALDYNPDTYE